MEVSKEEEGRTTSPSSYGGNPVKIQSERKLELEQLCSVVRMRG